MEKFLALLPSNLKTLPPWLILAAMSWLAYEQNRTNENLSTLNKTIVDWGVRLSVLETKYDEHVKYSTFIFPQSSNSKSN